MTKRSRKPPPAAPRANAPAPFAAGLSGALLRMAGQTGEVRPDFDKIARELDSRPKEAALAEMFGAVRRADRLGEQVARLRAAAEADPGSDYLQLLLGDALRQKGDLAAAIAAFRRCLELNPDADPARYLLASLGAAEVPESMPSAMVATIFNTGAPQFEQLLVGRLKYQGPALIEKALAPHLSAATASGRGLDVIDAGCGTGLCAPFLHRFAQRLDGVDLSPAMIERARAKGLYDRLGVGELCATLLSAPAGYDLIVAADVLVYIGALEPVFAAAHAALRAGGLFAFTVERGEGEGLGFNPSARYVHSAAYVEERARAAGFVLRERQEGWLRFEAGKGVDALVYVLARR